ncbi:MAG: acyl carrier protein [Roseivirga sp.]|nr:acyl carrier protein [Roseivirga sp.]
MERFISKFEELLELDDGTIKKTDVFREFSEWDSLAVLGFSVMVNEEYNVIIPKVEFDKLITIGDVYNYIQSKKV